ncbi:EAL domain-containing protein [Paraburkholderia caribensis]|nr:EAL domain-containing protein [Paraburkholderia caribensis]
MRGGDHRAHDKRRERHQHPRAAAADRNLYGVKRLLVLSHRLRLRADLDSASAAGQFELYYQPQLNLDTGCVYGAEALLRWNHPQLGLLTPAAFLDVLLESPAYEATGEWLIHLALRQAAQWQVTDRMRFKVAVNLSAAMIQNADLAALVSKAAEAAGVCASVLDIEVTETVIVSDFLAASRSLAAVRKLGVTVSLDDFGTGYSSLSYLTKLPVDRIKIDKSFVQQLTVDESRRQARAMIEAMVALARALGKETVAEGVENEEQLAFVRKLGCNAARILHRQASTGCRHRTSRKDAVGRTGHFVVT